MVGMQELSSRARVDELSYVILNGKTGLTLYNRFGVETPELKQFQKFVSETATIHIGKPGMAPMFVSSFAADLQAKYSSVRDLIGRFNEEHSKEITNQLIAKLAEISQSLDDLSLIAQKTLLR